MTYTYRATWNNNRWSVVHEPTQETIRYFPNWEEAYQYACRLNMYYDHPFIVNQLRQTND